MLFRKKTNKISVDNSKYDSECYVDLENPNPIHCSNADSDHYEDSLYETYPYFQEASQKIVSICANKLNKTYLMHSSKDNLIVAPNNSYTLPDEIQCIVDRLIDHEVVRELADKIISVFVNGRHNKFFKCHGLIVSVGKSKISFSNCVNITSCTGSGVNEIMYRDEWESVSFNDLGMSNFNQYETLLGFTVALLTIILDNNKALIEKSIDLLRIYKAETVSYSDYSTYYHYSYGMSVLFVMDPPQITDDKQSQYRQW